MAKGWKAIVIGGLLGSSMAGATAWGQVIEEQRDTRVTGPRGRTIERDITVKRGPGFVDRQVEIKRPGETIVRDTRIRTGPLGRPGPGPFYGGAPRFYGGAPRFYDGPRFSPGVIVPGPAFAGFIGLPSLNFAFGGGAPVPPPVVVGPPAPPPAFDAFADAMGRLKSFHGHSRRDGAITLGRIGDPRAVPALNERLEHDLDAEVRVAAAKALGEIGDERGAVALERAIITEKRHHQVRDAAAEALKKIPRPGEVRISPATGNVPPPIPMPPTSANVPVIESRPSDVDPGPNPATIPQTNPRPSLPDQPPPPPVPVPNLERPNTGGPW